MADFDGCATPALSYNQAVVKRNFTARTWVEPASDGGAWHVAQCVEVDVASQGRSEAEALANLREALELYFETPTADEPPTLTTLEVEIAAA